MSCCTVYALLCYFVVVLVPSYAYKHIIFMHGVMAGPWEFNTISNWLKQEHPGTNYTVINQFNRVASLTNLWKQVDSIKETVKGVMKQNPDGVHLICYSQGGLVCRGLIESFADHNVKNFISLSAPLAGQYGDTSFFKFFFPKLVKEELYKFFYTEEGQKVSVGNYWNDPHHHSLYLKYSQFLSVINNETSGKSSEAYKTNFVKLKNLVLVGGPDDGVIMPWQSSQFGFYNSSEAVEDMKQQQWYKKDMFGLRTLDAAGRVHVYTVPKVTHLHWYRNRQVWDCCVKKWLD